MQEGEVRNQRGQTTVEFALVVGLLLILLFGIIDFSRLMFAYATMSNGVREGARYGVIHPGQDAQIIQRARAMMVLIGGTATVEVNYPKTDAQGNRYCSHKCTVVVTARRAATLMCGHLSFRIWNWWPSPRCISSEQAADGKEKRK